MWNEEIREKLRNKILPELEKEVWGLNDDMAAHPELGSHEFESSRKIVELLRAHGIEVEYPFCGLETAFRAVINPGGKKKAAFLAEYDALPEIGHGCGHCASGMASVMAALAVQQVRDSLGDVEIDVIGTRYGITKFHITHGYEGNGHLWRCAGDRHFVFHCEEQVGGNLDWSGGRGFVWHFQPSP